MRFIFVLMAICILSKAYGQYWQQEVNYEIDVTLNDRSNSLSGFENIIYTNNSPDTLRFIWFHLWPNAYKDERTAYGEQTLRNGSTQFYFSNKEEKGYINRLDFRVNGVAAKTQDHPQHIDITKLLLPSPLAPGEKIIITTPFHVKLPFNFSRSGYNKKNFQVTQWFPKPAVYDGKGEEDGWHPMPYLDQGEFYSEFGKFVVRITLPAHYVVAATGVLQTESEKQWLLAKSFASDSLRKIRKTPIAIDSNRTKTLEYVQDRVHDFAWFANPDLLLEHDTCQLASGKVIDLYSFYEADNRMIWKNSIQFMKDAVRFFSTEVGDYPYQTLTAVQGAPGPGGGMEYPTITVVSPLSGEKELDIVLAHEIGHNWFYGILASNERDHPWMDEGMTSFYEYKYTSKKYGATPQLSDILLQTLVNQKRDQPIISRSTDVTSAGYGAIIYHKTAKWLELIEKEIGAGIFRDIMRSYFEQWKFRHPQPADFYKIMQSGTGAMFQEYMYLLTGKGNISEEQNNGLQILSPLRKGSFRQYLYNPSQKALLISPAVGFNSYDKLMLGGIVSNYKLPPSSLQFVLAPLYSTGAKQMNGIGRLNFTYYSSNGSRQLDLFVSGARFSNNSIETFNGGSTITSFTKFVPGLSVLFKPKDQQSAFRTVVEWKSYFIGEQPLVFREDSVFQGIDTIITQSVSKTSLKTTTHQLVLGIANNRVLYPFSADVTLQMNQHFTRLAFEADYFFNYAKGGLFVRVFAGKLLRQNKNYPYGFDINRYALNLTGASGYEDYLYQDYFIGRNEYEGLASQQIMIRDGGFKVSTELLSKEVGKTGNWLGAVNLNTTIPSKMNPLSVFPLAIPIRLFADIGTYAEAWKQDFEGDRFLYDAGIQLSLNNNMINIYFPLFYSSEFSEYVKSVHTKNRFFRTVTFSIDLSASIKQMNRKLSF